MQNKTYKRRHILLLEVMIAFAIILLCIFPLLYPHVMIAKAQKEFIQKIELDHAVTLLFGQVYQDLLSNKIEWRDIEGMRKFDVSDEELKKYNQDRFLPFKGSYRFKKIKQKPPASQNPEATANLYEITFSFAKLNTLKNKLTKSKNNTSKYVYQVYILRDIRTEKENSLQSKEGAPENKPKDANAKN